MSEVLDVLSLAALPALKQTMQGGTFCGLTTRPDGVHCAIVRLHAKPDARLTHQQAIDWAAEVGGELPTRPVASQVFAVEGDDLEDEYHWTSERYGGSSAWFCYFISGTVDPSSRSCELAAVAVRLIPLSA